ncbi:MAG: hypothetical protein BWY78_00133 [Alphaproteobacteria bacterium ADurb.Bin438]|nr:MAG: hypothetical protein BWY78_00133 [Alphaproteobacteria bacterium ADurb.Bin438]
MKHILNLKKAYFNLIKLKQKTIELRVFDDKRKLIKIGDEIEFKCEDENLTVKVINIIKANDFLKLCEMIDIKKTGFSSVNELNPVMNEFYPLKTQQELSVLGIEFEII